MNLNAFADEKYLNELSFMRLYLLGYSKE